MPQSPAHRPPRPLIVAFVVFLLAAVAAASLIWRLEQNELQEQRAHASSLAIDHAHALQRSIERALSAVYALEALLRQGNGTISNFDAVGRQMLTIYPGVSGLSLAPGGIIRSVVPLAGNEKAVGLDLLTYPRTKKEASITRDTGKLTLTGPFTLAKGKLGAIGRLPIFLDDAKGNPSFWGFINVEIGFPEALEAASLSQLAEQGYGYELWRISPDTGQKLIIAASSSAALNEPVEHNVEVPNATWPLSIVPVKGWGNPLGLSLKAALGVLFSLLLAYMAKLMIELRAHKQGLEALVAQRTAEVQAREADLNRAQSIARVGSWMLDLARNEVRWSAETYRIFGVSGGTPLNHEAFLQHVHPDDRDAVDRAFQAVLKGERYDIEYRFVVGAAMRWMHGQADLQFTADGTQRTCVGTVQDITERKLAEEALARESHRNQVFLRNASDGVHILDADGNVLEVSDSFCEMLGYSREELIGAHVSLWNAQWSAQELMQRIAEQTAKKGHSVFETRHRRRDGGLLDVEITGQGLELDGNPVLFNSARDITQRKRTQESLRESEQELRASEARFRNLTAMSSDFYWESDAEQRITQGSTAANLNMAPVWGTQIGKRRWETPYLSPDEAAWQAHRAVLDAHLPFRDFQLSRLDPDGTERYLSVSGDPLFDASGAFQGYRGVGTDITERKRAESALRESEDRYRDLVENSGVLICTHDLEGKLLSVNAAVVRFTGYSREALLRMNVADLLTRGARDSFAAYLAEIRTKGTARGLMQTRTAGGKTRWWEYHNTLRTEDVAAPVVRGMGEDVTERKHTEESLRESEQELRAIFEGALDGIVVADAETRKLLTANAAMCSMLGYTIEEIVRTGVSDIHPKQDLPRVIEQFDRLLRGEIRMSADIPVMRKDGSVFYADIKASSIRFAGKDCMLGIFRDITERKRAEEALQQQHAMLLETERELLNAHESLAEADRLESVGRLAAGVAHEVKNPLAIIRLGTDYLAKQLSQESNQEVLDDIRAAIDRAEHVIRDLLGFSRQEPFAPRPTNINEVIDNAIHLIKHEIERRNIVIIRNHDDLMPPIYADPNRLVQVFINLLSNAAQAIGQDGSIEIVTRSICLSERDLERPETNVFRIGEPVIAVDIRDNGPGISAEYEKKLFQPFFTTKPVGEGTGLGLAVSRNIIIMHRGSIRISNRPEGGASALLMFRVAREHLTNEKANTGSR